MHSLPSHMQPSRIVALDEFPLTANGKIDHSLLAERAAIAPLPLISASSETERRLSEIFVRLLGARSIGDDTNFFHLGATSLNLVEAHA
jgi:hybrid polyketide synthase/nonribosomal peptide synthetase FtdB